MNAICGSRTVVIIVLVEHEAVGGQDLHDAVPLANATCRALRARGDQRLALLQLDRKGVDIVRLAEPTVDDDAWLSDHLRLLRIVVRPPLFDFGQQADDERARDARANRRRRGESSARRASASLAIVIASVPFAVAGLTSIPLPSTCTLTGQRSNVPATVMSARGATLGAGGIEVVELWAGGVSGGWDEK